MKSTNYPKINHEVIFIKRKNEIVFALPNGEEIASIKVCTMEMDEKQENGKYKSVPTDNFWLQFIPSKKCYDACMRDCASVIVDQ